MIHISWWCNCVVMWCMHNGKLWCRWWYVRREGETCAHCVGKAIIPEHPGVGFEPLFCLYYYYFSSFYCLWTITSHSPIVFYCLQLSHSTEMFHLLLLTLHVHHTVFWLTSDVVTPSATSEVCYLFLLVIKHKIVLTQMRRHHMMWLSPWPASDLNATTLFYGFENSYNKCN